MDSQASGQQQLLVPSALNLGSDLQCAFQHQSAAPRPTQQQLRCADQPRDGWVTVPADRILLCLLCNIAQGGGTTDDRYWVRCPPACARLFECSQLLLVTCAVMDRAFVDGAERLLWFLLRLFFVANISHQHLVGSALLTAAAPIHMYICYTAGVPWCSFLSSHRVSRLLLYTTIRLLHQLPSIRLSQPLHL